MQKLTAAALGLLAVIGFTPSQHVSLEPKQPAPVYAVLAKPTPIPKPELMFMKPLSSRSSTSPLSEPKQKPVEPHYTTYKITAYTNSVEDCGNTRGITASGKQAQAGVTVACDASIPFGTHILIKGVGEFICQDRGGAIEGNHIDIYVTSEWEAKHFGVKHLDVAILGK